METTETLPGLAPGQPEYNVGEGEEALVVFGLLHPHLFHCPSLCQTLRACQVYGKDRVCEFLNNTCINSLTS